MVALESLPIVEVLDDIRSHLSLHNRLILQAPPGAGKTTAVPLSLLNEPWLDGKQIIMLEPRRLAARSSASRMAKLLGEEVGKTVGFQIRSERTMSKETKILVVTEGILTRKLQQDPALKDIALIIFDEFHERHLHSDLSLAFALQTQEYLREDLKIMVMSATLDTRGLGELLESAPILKCEGRSHPITLHHLPPNSAPIDPKTIARSLFSLVCTVLKEETGDVLIFLPGAGEIKSLESLLITHVKEHSLDLLIAPLYGELSKAEQEKAIAPSQHRKVILSTNIAETSLTIEGVRIVVDSGLERVITFDSASGMSRLVTQKISRSSATQRAGRAGRLGPGVCYRLWSEISHHSLAPHSQPEITQSDLTPLALELASWGAHPDELRWIDPPPQHALQHGMDLLRNLNALKSPITITSHGSTILTLGVHPRLAHMILTAQENGYGAEAILLATLLSERDPLSRDPSSDLRDRFDILCDYLRHRPLPSHLCDRFKRLLESAAELAKRLGIPLRLDDDFSTEQIGVLLAMAYPDGIASMRESSQERYLTAAGKEAFLNPHDDLAGTQWLVIARSNGEAKRARIHLCTPIDFAALEHHFPHLLSTEQTLSWSTETQRVEAREVLRLGEIVLESRSIRSSDHDRIALMLCEGIRSCGLDVLPWSERGRSLQRRMELLRRYGKSGIDLSDQTLTDTLETWLLPYLGTRSSLRDLSTLDLYAILSSRIAWETLHYLDTAVPDTFSAPTGSKISINYSDPESPVLAIRIQELFGLRVHPSVMEGKVPLLLHLLSPARRPIQMTRDLVGFWNGSYSDVKKELKGRYPKHYWPDDPQMAQPTSKTKKFM